MGTLLVAFQKARPGRFGCLFWCDWQRWRGGLFEQVAKLLLIRQPLSHALDHFCGDEQWDVFILSSEDVPDVSDGSCMLGVELVAGLAMGWICLLLELVGNDNDVAEGRGVKISERHGCLGQNECAAHTPAISTTSNVESLVKMESLEQWLQWQSTRAPQPEITRIAA